MRIMENKWADGLAQRVEPIKRRFTIKRFLFDSFRSFGRKLSPPTGRKYPITLANNALRLKNQAQLIWFASMSR
jgi:hypothetical protein